MSKTVRIVMYYSQITVKRNGKPTEKGVTISLPEYANRLEDLKETICENAEGVKISGSSKFYSETGNEILDDTLFLLKDKEIIYLDQHGNPFDVNSILDQYEMQESLGQGGFGSVRKAKHRETGQIVAIKHIDITESSNKLIP